MGAEGVGTAGDMELLQIHPGGNQEELCWDPKGGKGWKKQFPGSFGIPKVERDGRSYSRAHLGSQRWEGVPKALPELIWDSQGGKGLQKLFPSSFGIPKALSGICAGSHFHVGQTLGTRAVCCDPKDKDSTRGQGSGLTSMPGFPGGPSSPGAPGSPLTPWKREKKVGISLG